MSGYVVEQMYQAIMNGEETGAFLDTLLEFGPDKGRGSNQYKFGYKDRTLEEFKQAYEEMSGYKLLGVWPDNLTIREILQRHGGNYDSGDVTKFLEDFTR